MREREVTTETATLSDPDLDSGSMSPAQRFLFPFFFFLSF